MIVLGPGSFYTSVLSALIVPGIAEAVLASDAIKIFVCNLMTEPGETERFGLRAHLDALRAHGLPPDALDYVVFNDAPIPECARARYVAQGAEPVTADVAVPALGPAIVAADLLAPGAVVRHDHDKLGRLLCTLATPPMIAAPAEVPLAATLAR